jgi:hypothetical protein
MATGMEAAAAAAGAEGGAATDQGEQIRSMLLVACKLCIYCRACDFLMYQSDRGPKLCSDNETNPLHYTLSRCQVAAWS